MRILQVFNRYLERGGEEASVERISNILSEHHKVFHCYFDSQMWKYETSLWSLIKQAGMMLWNPDATKRFNRHIEACKPDLILIHNVFPVGSLSILNAATKLQIPVAYVIHNFRPFSVNGYLWADGKILPQGLNLDFFPEIFCGSWQNSRTKTALLAFVILTAHSLGIYRKIDCWLAISEFMRISSSPPACRASKRILSVVKPCRPVCKARSNNLRLPCRESGSVLAKSAVRRPWNCMVSLTR